MSERGSSASARAAAVATVYALASLLLTLVRRLSLATAGAVTVLVWAGTFVGWWLVFVLREGPDPG